MISRDLNLAYILDQMELERLHPEQHHVQSIARNPPFREQDDIDALIKAIQEDVVCAIATDHAPHTTEDKRNGSPGMIGLELAFPLCYTKLVKGGFVSLNKLMQLMSTNPSKMMKLNKGRIVAGCQADLVIADLDTIAGSNLATYTE